MRAILALCLMALTFPALAETYRVAPAPGAVQALLDSGKIVAGDVILMQDGDHGPLVLSGAFAGKVTIRAEHKRKAHVDSIHVKAPASNLTIANLNVWPTDPYTHGTEHVATARGASNITFNGLDIRGGQDAANFPAWSKDEWVRRSANAVWLSGPNSAILNSTMTGVRFGVVVESADAPDARVVGNTINGFSGDGLRGQGDRGIFRDNLIQNCVSIDDNHADGFQAHTTPDKPITGLVIERNRIFEWNLAPNPLRCGLQGIGMFDGWYDQLVIRNNLVVVSNGHGISVMGARGAVLSSNTATTASGLPGKWPWIDVYGHKNGTPSSNVIVANNLAMDIGQPKPGVVFIDNGRITDPATQLDLTTYAPRAGSGFKDTANPGYAPVFDVYSKRRPGGAANDKGAVEAP